MESAKQQQQQHLFFAHFPPSVQRNSRARILPLPGRKPPHAAPRRDRPSGRRPCWTQVRDLPSASPPLSHYSNLRLPSTTCVDARRAAVWFLSFFLSIVDFDPRAQPTHCAISPAPLNLARTAAQIRPPPPPHGSFFSRLHLFACSAQSQKLAQPLDGDLAVYLYLTWGCWGAVCVRVGRIVA